MPNLTARQQLTKALADNGYTETCDHAVAARYTWTPVTVWRQDPAHKSRYRGDRSHLIEVKADLLTAWVPTPGDDYRPKVVQAVLLTDPAKFLVGSVRWDDPALTWYQRMFDPTRLNVSSRVRPNNPFNDQAHRRYTLRETIAALVWHGPVQVAARAEQAAAEAETKHAAAVRDWEARTVAYHHAMNDRVGWVGERLDKYQDRALLVTALASDTFFIGAPALPTFPGPRPVDTTGETS